MNAEEVEMALDAIGLPWSRRDGGWAVPAADGVARELRLSPADGGVRVEAVLIEWDEAGDDSRAALARFLSAAQGSLRHAHCERDERQARVVAQLRPAELETGLADALLGVSAGCRFLAREASALLSPELARLYLAFHGPSPSGMAGPGK
jgi:hypothetical protein